MLNDYVEKNGMMGMATIKLEEAQTVVNNALASDSAKAILAGLEKEYVVPQDTFSTVYNQLMLGFIQGIMMPVDSMGMGNMSGAQMPSMPAENTLSNEITSIPENVTQNMPSTNGATSEKMAIITKDTIDTMVNMFVSQDAIISAAEQFAAPMTEAVMQKTILTKVGELTGKLMEKVAGAFSVDADKITFVAAATKAAVAKGVHAGNIIKEITKVTDGRGGGKPDMAQGGGKLVNKVDDALAMVDDLVIAQTGGNK